MEQIKKLTFEDYLKEVHAEDYLGTDDNMPDAFDDWLTQLDSDDLIRFSEELVAKLQTKPVDNDFSPLTLKEQADRREYYRIDLLTQDLKEVLRSSRQEPGLSLESIANITKQTLKTEEVATLIKLLEK